MELFYFEGSLYYSESNARFLYATIRKMFQLSTVHVSLISKSMTSQPG